MSANTKIEWCHATVNWWAGCTKVSPACDNCYAQRMAGRLWDTEWGAGEQRHQFLRAESALYALDRKAERLGQPLSVFHNSLSDFFDNEVPLQWRIAAMRAMVGTPHLIHLLLTKRIGNAPAMLEQAFRAVHAQREGWADNVPPNVWIGATVVNQEEADRDIPKLLAVPAAKRFLSMEPLLGAVDLTIIELSGGDFEIYPLKGTDGCTDYGGDPVPDIPAIDWVIVGGESGPNARPMHPAWARSLRDQCEAAEVPFLFKQWGEWAPGNVFPEQIPSGESCSFDDSTLDDDSKAWKVGKKAAGRLLDGREWNGFPS